MTPAAVDQRRHATGGQSSVDGERGMTSVSGRRVGSVSDIVAEHRRRTARWR